MASLSDQAIKVAYQQILHVDTAGGGNGTTLMPVKDGDNGTTFAVEMSTDKLKATKTFLQTKKTHSALGPIDNVNVADCNILCINAAANAVTIGGFAGGVDGQVLDVVIVDATNNVTIENNEGGGSQDIQLAGGADVTKTAAFGGWRLYCNGTKWFQIA